MNVPNLPPGWEPIAYRKAGRFEVYYHGGHLYAGPSASEFLIVEPYQHSVVLYINPDEYRQLKRGEVPAHLVRGMTVQYEFKQRFPR